MAFGHHVTASLAAQEAQKAARDQSHGEYEADYVKRLKREIAILQRECDDLRTRADRAERRLAYMDQHYMPKAALRGVRA